MALGEQSYLILILHVITHQAITLSKVGVPHTTCDYSLAQHKTPSRKRIGILTSLEVCLKRGQLSQGHEKYLCHTDAADSFVDQLRDWSGSTVLHLFRFVFLAPAFSFRGLW